MSYAELVKVRSHYLIDRRNVSETDTASRADLLYIKNVLTCRRPKEQKQQKSEVHDFTPSKDGVYRNRSNEHTGSIS